ncbi:MAG: hypothetical protein OXF01_11575, partial [Gemmatimonadetes bacterium]|nr:hypothetical protein [Gemmatimonadota bacterium]
MRTGAIFARGSCRALRWLALLGMVFVLGAGSALAQVKVEVPKSVDEAGRLEITVTADVRVAARTDDDVTLPITVAIAAGATDNSKGLSMADGTDGDADVTHPTGAFDFEIKANSGATASDRTGLKKTFNIQTLPDLDAEDEAITVTVTLGTVPTGVTRKGKDSTDTDSDLELDDDSDDAFKVTINDTDPQEFKWDAPDKPKEGSDIVVKLMADPAPVDLVHSVPLSIDAAGYTLDETTATLNVDGPTATITIDPPDSDGDRDEDEITLRALKAGTTNDLIDPLPIKVADIHKLPEDDDIEAEAFQDDGKGKITKNKATSVMEGGDPVHVTITVDRGDDNYPSGEKLKVEVVADDPAQGVDYRVDDDEFELPAEKGEQDMTIKLWARVDDNIEPEEELKLNLIVSGAKDENGSGQSMGMFSIVIKDDTTALVEVKDSASDAVMEALGEDPLNPGAEVVLMLDDLFEYDKDMVNVTPSASVDGSGVRTSSSGDSVTVTAEEPGDAKVTVTATARPKSNSLVTSSQTEADVAHVTFDVSVVLSELTVTVTADPMEIDEGGMSTITARASREVAMSDGEVKVDLVLVGAGELSAPSITIAAGEMTGTATVTAMEDDEDYEDETLTVVAKGAGEATITIMVDDNDTPPEPTNVITAKSSEEIYPLLMAAGLAGDDAMFNPGMTAQLDASEMFDMMDGYSASYAAGSDAMNVAGTSTSGNMVSVTAGEAGMAHVTITATATMASGVTTGQPETNVATVMFPVNVTNMPLAVTVSTDPMDMVEEGGTITVTATANRDVVADDGDVQVTLTITGAVEMNEATIAIAAGSSNSTMIQVLDDMEVAPMADIAIVATGSGIATAQTFNLSVTEDDVETTYTLTASPETVEEGGEVTITATASQAALEDTTIELSQTGGTASDGDYGLDPMSITIMMGEITGTATLTATDDYDVEGNETLTLQGAMGSMIVASVMITIEDNDAETTYTLSASAEMVEEGGTVTITATASQMVRANTEVMVMRDAASTAGDDDYSLEPPLITIMEGETEGSLTLTATDDTDVEGEEKLTLNGMVGDMAAGSVMLSIADNDMLSTYTLSGGPDDSNLVEGMSYELTVTADPAVQVDTTVMIMRDGTSSAGDADFEVGEVAIAAGSATGTTTLMAVEDSMAEDMEMLVLYGMEGNQRTENSLTFNIWDAAVPA